MYIGAPSNANGGQVPMVFISYQWNIQDQVLKLKKKLESKNITCWMDTNKMMGGDDLKREIDKGIRGCKVSTLFLQLTKNLRWNTNLRSQLH